VSDASSLPDQIEKMSHALTAVEIAKLLGVSRILIYKLAKSNRLPCFRIGGCMRFDPRQIAQWLRRN
jgi:excisionase family DNA binding protein